MKALLRPLLLLVPLLAFPAVHGARISEPATTFYGRVFVRTAAREFLITEGTLRWTLVNDSQGGREYTVSGRLEPLADGVFSYRLSIPHQVLAYDLSVADRSVPVTATGLRLRHKSITVDGHAGSIVAPAIDGFTAQQSQRATTLRVDLEVEGLAADSDGDGLPDWWEDLHGLDKWNPTDALASPGSGSNPGNTAETGGSPSSFSQWREHHFPGATGDLNAFGQEDPDRDGIPNLLEYAFELDPWSHNEASLEPGLPKAELRDGCFALSYRKRTAATDLEYRIELSDDLITWQTSASEVEAVPLSEEQTQAGYVCVRERGASEDVDHRYIRVRVQWNP